jgi:hypothetical protein
MSDNFERYEFGQPGLTRFTEIPKLLHSVELARPFTHCFHCRRNLLDSEHLYLIEKVFRGHEPILEVAMCLDCREQQCDDGMSSESAAAMRKHFEKNVDVERRLFLLAQVNDDPTIRPWIERCLLLDQPQSTFNEFQIIALCRGDKIQRDFFPALISGPAVEQISSLLSSKTRDWMDDYIGTNFGMPSEFCEPPSFAPFLV